MCEDFKHHKTLARCQNLAIVFFREPKSQTNFYSDDTNFEIKYWINYPGPPSILEMTSRGVKAIKAAFDKEGITIPFPIRTLDFGIKGGEKLSEMKLKSGD